MDTTFGALILGGNMNPYVLVVLGIVASLAGMLTNWYKKYFRDQTTASMFQYFFVFNFRGTVYAIGAMLAGLFAAFAPIDYTTISAYQVVMQAFAIGYVADSAFNGTTIGVTQDGTKIDPAAPVSVLEGTPASNDGPA